MKSLKVLTAITLFFFLFNESHAQSGKEIGLTMSSFSNYNLYYKKPLKENKYLRLGLTSLNVGTSLFSETTAFNSNMGIAVGMEKRKNISDNFDYFYGLEGRLGGGLAYNNNGRTVTSRYISPGLHFVGGIGYNLGNKLRFTAEFTPGLSYSYSKATDSSPRHNFSLSGFGSRARLGLFMRL